MPWVASAGTRSKPQRAAFVGPSNSAKTPSPVCLARLPPYLASTVSTNRSWSSRCRRQCSSPCAASSSVEPTMSVNRTVLSTRSAGIASACWPTNSSTICGKQVDQVDRVVLAWRQFAQLGVGYTGRQRLPPTRRGDAVTSAAQHHGGRADSRRAHVADVDLGDRIPHHVGHHRAGRCPLLLAEHLAYSRDIGNGPEENVRQSAFAPVVFDVFMYRRRSVLGREPPWQIGQLLGESGRGADRGPGNAPAPGRSRRTRGSSGRPRRHRPAPDNRPRQRRVRLEGRPCAHRSAARGDGVRQSGATLVPDHQPRSSD